MSAPATVAMKPSSDTIASPLVELHTLGKIYYTDEIETHSLVGVDLAISSGEFVAVAGPSGSGKTTLLSILGMLDTATSGSYTFDSKAVTDLSSAARARIRNREIGFVFQAFNLIGDLTVEENVQLPLTYRRGLTRESCSEMAGSAIERVGLADRRRHFPYQLSGGQQQRVAVARAFAGLPRMILADEPTGNLDTANGEAIMALLSALHESGTTVCLVTHEPRYVGYAQRAIHLLDGRIVSGDHC